ncbi:hypothetical protein MMC07_009410 [Pseudocyphellaria aurata]|nr:hypothetical protein [Pseudocyphellaria aurata]
MDPLSVTASAASLAQLCVAIVSALKLVRDASNVEFAVYSLREEVKILGDVLNRIAETFSASPMQTSFQQTHERDVRLLLDRCRSTLGALREIISGLEGEKHFASKLLKQIRLNRVTQDISILKANIDTCTQMLQVSLMTIGITMHQEHQSSIQELHQAISEVKKSLSSRTYQGFIGGPLQVDNPLALDVKNLLNCVENEMDTTSHFKYDPEGGTITPTNSEGSQVRANESFIDGGVENNKDTLDWLRRKGVSTENLDVSRPKAMNLAIKEGQVAVLHVLLNQVSKSRERRALLADAMQLAVSVGQLRILESLIEIDTGPSIDELLPSGRTLLIAAIIAGNHQIVEWLLLHGADPETMCATEMTPLVRAVNARDQGVVQLLLHGKALIDARTWDRTPLHFAVDNGDRDMVELLLRNHADIEASCPRDFSQKTYTPSADLRKSVTVGSTTEVEPYCTPLFRASINADDMMVELLLGRGADPEAKNSGQATALICAAEEQFEEIVELLLKNNASVNAKDQWGWTPLHRAQVKQDDERVTRILLNYKAEVDARCGKQRTPLHWAAEWGNALTVPILLDHKADIEAKDSAGRTPLHVAIDYRQTEMVILLVERGADVTAQNGEGHDALAAALHVERQRRCPEIIAYLKEDHLQSSTGFIHHYPLT